MAVIQDEQGNNKPIKTDTSHVFDVNGNPLHGELFIGETIASDDVEAIDGYAHESDIAELQFEYGTVVPIDVINDTSFTPTSNGFLVGRVRKASGTSAAAFGITSSALDGGYKYLCSCDISEGYIPVGSIFLIAGETVTFAKNGVQASGTVVSFLPIKVKVS